MAVRELIDKLNCEKKLSHDEWVKLIKEYDEGDRAYAAELARGISQEMFGKDIYIRGIVEFSNICKNDCLYCGIRRSNGNVSRYRLTAEEILQCCDEGRNVLEKPNGVSFRSKRDRLSDRLWNDDRLAVSDGGVSC